MKIGGLEEIDGLSDLGDPDQSLGIDYTEDSFDSFNFEADPVEDPEEDEAQPGQTGTNMVVE